jgi:hypothetical protein
MTEIPRKDVAKFTAIPALGLESRVTDQPILEQRSWEVQSSPYVLLIESSPEYRLTTDDNGYGILIS